MVTRLGADQNNRVREANVGLLQGSDLRPHPQRLVQLPASDIDRVNAFGAALQQYL